MRAPKKLPNYREQLVDLVQYNYSLTILRVSTDGKTSHRLERDESNLNLFEVCVPQLCLT